MDKRALNVLEAIITSSKAPLGVIQKSAVLMIDAVLADGTTASPSRSLLAGIQQRNPSAFHQAIDEVSTRGGMDRESLEQLRISLSIVGHHFENVDPRRPILASFRSRARLTRAGPAVKILETWCLPPPIQMPKSGPLLSTAWWRSFRGRKIYPSLKRLVRNCTAGSCLIHLSQNSIHYALLARVQDTHQGVIDVLYGERAVILPVFNENSEAYIEHLSAILSAPGAKPKWTLVCSHLTFLMSHFILANPARSEYVFQRIVFPFLLYSKPRRHTADVVWGVVSSPRPPGNNTDIHEWITGCTSIVEAETEKAGSDGLERMVRMNLAVSCQIARE